jgi:hypothetical protein
MLRLAIAVMMIWIYISTQFLDQPRLNQVLTEPLKGPTFEHVMLCHSYPNPVFNIRCFPGSLSKAIGIELDCEHCTNNISNHHCLPVWEVGVASASETTSATSTSPNRRDDRIKSVVSIVFLCYVYNKCHDGNIDLLDVACLCKGPWGLLGAHCART